MTIRLDMDTRRSSGHLAALARLLGTALLGLMLAGLGGCAAFTNPVANGIPVRLLPPELLAEPQEGKVPLPLACLKRQPSEKYLLQAGDVLSVFIEGVLGQRDEPPPVNIAQGEALPPSLGFPIPVRDDGTLPLPLIQPLQVTGMPVEQAEQTIVKAYTSGDHPILEPGRARILVTLLRPRLTRVLVIRQDSPAIGIDRIIPRERGVIESTRELRGGINELFATNRAALSTVVNLPGNENDVMTALAYTGGLPGLDARNEIVIERVISAPGAGMVPRVMPPPVGTHQMSPCGPIVRIPLRLRPCDPIPFQPEDIILHDGDILYIPARDAQVFYTGGLLPSGEFPLPRDYDLDVVELIAAVGGPLVNGGVNTNNLSGQIIMPGIGFPSPRLVTVLRRVPGRGQVSILVDLNLALRDPRENLIVQAGDVILLQETRDQALARYWSNVFNFNFFSNVIERGSATGVTTLSVP